MPTQQLLTILPIESRRTCQYVEPWNFARLRRPWFVFLGASFFRRIGQGRFREIPASVVRVLRRRLGLAKLLPPAQAIPDEVLGLQVGEWVEVKSIEEIASTLDPTGRLRGLAFLDGMKPCCGQRYTVYKRLEKVFFEESGRQRRMKNAVLLAGSVCQGEGIGCDRSCLFFWREAWLRRVPSQEPLQGGAH